MEAKVLGLIGSGLSLMGCRTIEAVPPGGLEHGFEVVARLIASGHRAVGVMVLEIARSLADDSRDAGFTLPDHCEQIVLLPKVMDHLKAALSLRLGAYQVAESDIDKDLADRALATALAIEIIDSAIERQIASKDEIDPYISVTLLTALFRELLDRRGAIMALSPMITQAMAECASEAGGLLPEDNVSTAPAASSTSAGPQLPPALAAQLARALADWSGGQVLTIDLADHKLSEYRAIVGALTPAETVEDDVHDLWGEALAALADGRIADADQLLGDAEMNDIKASEDGAANPKRQIARALATRIQRGRIEELRFCGRRATGHYAGAFRFVPIEDRATRWQLTMLQAEAMLRHGQTFEDVAAVKEALQSYTQAHILQTPQDDALASIATFFGETEARMALARISKRSMVLREIIGRLEKALTHPALQVAAIELMQLRNALGDVQWQFGRMQQDRSALAAAAELKLAVMASLAQAGFAEEARRIGQELPELLADLDTQVAA